MVENEKSSTCLTTCIYYICTRIKSISGRRVDENVEKLEFLYISGGKCITASATLEKNLEIHKKGKTQSYCMT